MFLRTTAALVLLVQAPPPQRPVIRSAVTFVDTTVVVHDEHGRFVADLLKSDFEVYEDGIRQEVANFALVHGGRMLTGAAGTRSSQPEGVLLPPMRGDESTGRVFLVFVDDSHLDFRQTAATRDLLKKIHADVIHDGDLFGIVSSGTSSIAVDLTYDRRQLLRAAEKVAGGGLSPSEIIGTPEGANGPPEVRHRAHVAFSTAYEILQRLGEVRDRRKSVLYISSGYDFDPFSKSRAAATSRDTRGIPDTNPFAKQGNEFAAADLASELSELTRQANRANTTIYTLDPRGLVGGADIDQRQLDAIDWQDHVRETQNSLRTIADLTGGFAAVNTNNFSAALKRIDNETSDNYIIGYYSSNSDVSKKRRTIEIRVADAEQRRHKRYQLTYKTSYTLKPAGG